MLLSRPRDTSPQVWELVVNRQRTRTGGEKLVCAVELSGAVRRLLGGDGDTEMKRFEELFGFVINALNSLEAPYMIVGSFASTFHGVARATQDLNIVCEVTANMLEPMSRLFEGPDFYFNQPAALEAIESRGMFNVLHIPTGWKIDFIVRKNRPFSRREFSRRTCSDMFGRAVYVATAEDTVLAKLEWARSGQSERQLRDVAEVLDVRRETIDWDYLEAGVNELGLEEMMDKLKRQDSW